jgi:malonyl CoA-acyl carrier protein transacylase
MGDGLFTRFPKLVEQADDIVGYSLAELCLADPDGRLKQTQYTQVALFVVNALSFLALSEARPLPDYVLGHSLGEYDALFAAGVISFADGVRLVARRGALMAQARDGGMAAVVGLREQAVHDLLREEGLHELVVANLNAPTQTVIAGPAEAIQRASAAFERARANYVPLNVSGAFHSPLMADAAADFRSFLASFRFAKAHLPVIANVSARPYADAPVDKMLVEQITSPVRWCESIRYLLDHGVEDFVEVGPGRVLATLVSRIRRDAPQLEQSEPALSSRAASREAPTSARPKLVFMYAGQGAHYYNMGRELYEQDATFRRTMDELSQRLAPELDRPLTSVLYDPALRLSEFKDIVYTNPALFALQYALTKVLEARGLVPDVVLGSSMGELVASVVAGVLDLPTGLSLAVRSAKLFAATGDRDGGMMVVLEKRSNIGDAERLFGRCTVAADNYDGNFILSGARRELQEIGDQLGRAGVATAILPIAFAFHSSWLDKHEAAFRTLTREIRFAPGKLPIYSAVSGGEVPDYSASDLWRAQRLKIRFSALIEQMNRSGRFVFADLSPTGSLAGFLRWGFANRLPAPFAMNQYGHNLKSLEKMTCDIASLQKA